MNDGKWKILNLQIGLLDLMEEFFQSGSNRICHFPFAICHFSLGFPSQWQMKNEQWKMENIDLKIGLSPN